MRLLMPLADVTAPLARRNPVAKLAAALVFTLPLLATLDPVAPTVALALELAVVPLFGVAYGRLAARVWPIALSAVGVVVTIVLFASTRTGAVLVELGSFDITTGVLVNALALALRLVAVAIPGVLVVATIDPTELADSLVRFVKAPPRFAIGSLAAFRLVPLLGDEWEMLTLARRARGIDAGAHPVRRVRLFASTAFALLVGAIRRGTRLAVAMDARGFDSGHPRTMARPPHWGTADTLLILGALVAAALPLGASLATGAFRPLIS